MLSILPVLSSFPFITILPANDISNTFNIEVMHTFSLVKSKTLKDYICIRLGNNEGTEIFILYSSGQAMKFKFLGRTRLFDLKKFHHVVKVESAGQRLRVDYLIGIVENLSHGLLNKNEKMGMLEGFDYDQVDKASPFQGAIVDHLCGTGDTAMITLVSIS